jgi:hypothetical protein
MLFSLAGNGLFHDFNLILEAFQLWAHSSIREAENLFTSK